MCPDEQKVEEEGTVFYNTIIGLEGDTHETLTCRATWPNDLDSSETYMVGTLDYRYKRTIVILKSHFHARYLKLAMEQ